MSKLNKIKQELEDKTPNLTNEIKSQVDWNQIKENNVKTSPKTSYGWKIALVAVCCSIALFMAIFLPIFFTNNGNGFEYSLIIDVNPSVKLSIDKNDIVTKQTALNEDAVILLYKKNLVGKKVDAATKSILDEMNLQHLLKNDIKISIKDSSGHNLKDKQTNIMTTIENYLNDDNINILILSDIEEDDIEEYYENNNVSDYEKTFIEKFRTQLINVVNETITYVENLTTSLNKLLDNYTTDLDFAKYFSNSGKKEDIVSFVEKYHFELDDDIDLDNMTKSGLEDFISEISDYKQDLQDNLEEITEENDDYGEVLEDLFELVKEDLFDKD